MSFFKSLFGGIAAAAKESTKEIVIDDDDKNAKEEYAPLKETFGRFFGQEKWADVEFLVEGSWIVQ